MIRSHRKCSWLLATITLAAVVSSGFNFPANAAFFHSAVHRHRGLARMFNAEFDSMDLQAFYLRKYGYASLPINTTTLDQALVQFTRLFPGNAVGMMRQPRCGLQDLEERDEGRDSVIQQPEIYSVIKFSPIRARQVQAEEAIHAIVARLSQSVPGLPRPAAELDTKATPQLRFHLREAPCLVGGGSAVSGYRYNSFTRVHEVTICLWDTDDSAADRLDQIVLHNLGHVYGLSHVSSGQLVWSPLYGVHFSNRPESLIISSRQPSKSGQRTRSRRVDCEYLYRLFMRNSRVDSVLLTGGNVLQLFSGELKYSYFIQGVNPVCSLTHWREEFNLLPAYLQRIDAACLLPAEGDDGDSQMLVFSGKHYWILTDNDNIDEWSVRDGFPPHGRPIEVLGLPLETDSVDAALCDSKRVVLVSDGLYWVVSSSLTDPADARLYPRPAAWLHPMLSKGKAFYSEEWQTVFALVGTKFVDLASGQERHLLADIMSRNRRSNRRKA